MLTHLDDRIPDPNLGMANTAGGRSVPLQLNRVECSLIELDGRRGVADDQVGPNAAQADRLVRTHNALLTAGAAATSKHSECPK
jgi:hypothetical protein